MRGRSRDEKCEYRKALVDAASLVVHGDIEVQDVATRELAEGVVFLDLEMEAVQIDLEKAEAEIERLRRGAS